MHRFYIYSSILWNNGLWAFGTYISPLAFFVFPRWTSTLGSSITAFSGGSFPIVRNMLYHLPWKTNPLTSFTSWALYLYCVLVLTSRKELLCLPFFSPYLFTYHFLLNLQFIFGLFKIFIKCILDILGHQWKVPSLSSNFSYFSDKADGIL